MTHELKKIVSAYQEAHSQGVAAVLATVVALNGSSYRRPGVRMLLLENGKMVGAVSGGCVEKEVFRQASTVFESGTPKVMTYDGRYRLGCEGILYILLEPFAPNDTLLTSFWSNIASRKQFTITTYFEQKHKEHSGYGSIFQMDGSELTVRPDFHADKEQTQVFEQSMQPCFKLVIIGAEHDTVQLCSLAAISGWEVMIVADPREEKDLKDFPGATNFIAADGEGLSLSTDTETAVVLMTHSYVKDLKYLLSLQHERPAYFGLLGPARRREKLFSALLEQNHEINEEFIEHIHGPSGLDIGAETPQEIAISIMAEILAVVNDKKAIPLKEKKGQIHS